MHAAVRLLIACTALALSGCSMLASVFEDRTLRTGTMLVIVAAAVGFVVSRMRRP